VKGVLAIARREILEKRNVVLAAAVASLIPLLLPLLPALQRHPADEVRLMTAAILGAAFGLGLAIVLGASVLVRELADRRLGFYFARPLSGFAIWTGKFLGGLLLVLGSGLLVFLPAALFSAGSAPWNEGTAHSLLLFPAVLLLLSAAHAVSLAVRSRSALFLLDLALAAATALAVTEAARRLLREHAREAFLRGIAGFAVIALAGFLAAGAASVIRGRTDIQRAHRALSATLWTILLGGTILFAAYAGWVLGASPKDLAGIWGVHATPRGSWIDVSGKARWRGDYQLRFLLNTSTGGWRKLPPGWFVSPSFSRDGSRAVWLQRSSVGDRFELLTMALDDPSPKPVETKLLFSSIPLAQALSADGERMAVVERAHDAGRSLLSVYEIASGKSLGSLSLPFGGKYQTYFDTPDGVFVYGNLPSGAKPKEERIIEILRFDLTTRKAQVTGRAGPFAGAVLLRAHPQAGRLLVHEFRKKEITLRDARSGDLLAILSPGAGTSSRGARFVSDGRIAAAEAGPAGARVRVFSTDGIEEKAIPLGAGASIFLGGEPAGGQIIASIRRGTAAPWSESKVFLVDISSGEARQVAEGLLPISAFQWWLTDDPSLQPSPGSEATKLFSGPDHSLVRFDPATGKRRVILAGRKD